LSRDWCVAHAAIRAEGFAKLKALFVAEKEKEIEKFLLESGILNNFSHDGTFIINNPVKPNADQFISQLATINVPVFIATGDNANAGVNIAKVLCPVNTREITIIRSEEERKLEINAARDTTIVFAGINKRILKIFDELLMLPFANRPAIIFSEMSAEGKGILARHLKAKKFFVVANGDGCNDIAMMSSADFVIAHVMEDGSYARGVEELVNLSDRQLQKLCESNKSFYELFDIHLPQSQFVELFARLANSQEKVSHALILKSAKTSFELARKLNFPVIEMWQQHYSSIVFDLVWLGISFNEIIDSSELPIDSQHLMQSKFPNQIMVGTLSFAALTAMLRYATSGESTNWDTMAYFLLIGRTVLKSMFTAYGQVQKEIAQATPLPESSASVASSKGGFFYCRRRRLVLVQEESKLEMERKLK